jgi:CubicO group peptidase (beta-lactamase class C family)
MDVPLYLLTSFLEGKMIRFRVAVSILFCVLTFGGASSVHAEAPFVDPADDAKYLGPPDIVLFWTPVQKVAGFRNVEKLFPTRTIHAGGVPFELPEQLVDLSAVQISYAGSVLTVDEYFVRQNVAGLLVIKNGRIVYERYGLGNSRDTRWISFSVAKSVTSMLIGAAIQDGYIKSVDEKVTDYLPRLKGSSYDHVSIRNLLQMASGVAWNEDYADPDSDVNSADWRTLGLYAYLRAKQVVTAPGKVFHYNTAETNLVGTLLRAAIGNNLATYLTEKIWRPFGMEADATWMLTEPGGGEFGGCCVSATLRDYGRLGIFALRKGRLVDGTLVVPDYWMAESTAPSKGAPWYGYLWWLGADGAYWASGIFGQGIHIDPQEDVVIAVHSARAIASNSHEWALQYAMYTAFTKALSRTD